MSEIEYPILPVVKRSIAKLATICRYLLVAGLVCAVAEPLIFITLQHPICILFGTVSDHLMQLLLALLTLPALWCHYVLLAARGTRITAMLCLFCCILGGILITCLAYEVATGGQHLLQHQHDAPLYISILLLICYCSNWHNMAAYKSSAKAVLLLFFFSLLLAAATMDFVPLFALAAKAIACAIGFFFLRKLEQTAPRIISMPER